MRENNTFFDKARYHGGSVGVSHPAAFKNQGDVVNDS